MPKSEVVKQDTLSEGAKNTALNAAKALAEAIGSSVQTSSGTASGTKYEVSFGPVGYPDIKLVLDNVPDSGDYSAVAQLVCSSFSKQLPPINNWMLRTSGHPDYNAVNCYVVRDSNNDTVLVGMHPGTTPKAEYTGYDVENAYLCLFIGKDVNDNIICGIGLSHIATITNGLKTIGYSSSTQTSNHNLSKYGGPSDTMQFVKMRNYLEDGCPEMKTAYVAIVRDDLTDKDTEIRSNLSYYADGSLWGSGGSNYTVYAPIIDPWVKY